VNNLPSNGVLNLGAERNPSRRSDQVRVMYVIEARRVAGQG